MPKTLCLVLAVAAVGWVFLPLPQPARGADDEVMQSIGRAQKWLEGLPTKGVWPQEDDVNQGARGCLAVYTLAYTGENPDGPVLGPSLDEALKLSPGRTYPRAVRVLALSAVARKLDKAGSARAKPVHEALRADVRWLIEAQGKNGGWNYLPMTENETRIDFSNTQMAILALWQASLAGEEVPPDVWLRTQKLYYKNQLEDGSWNYGDEKAPDGGSHPGYGSMTAAGLASIYVIADMLNLESNCPCRVVKGDTPKSDLYPRIDKALGWLAREFTADNNPKLGDRWHYYWLYSVERVGIAAGYKYMGTHNWYKEGSGYLLSHQAEDGSWGGNIVDTCFAVLFLYKGRAPILFEKLDCGPKIEWNPHRRDLSNLSAYIEKYEEMPIRWQITTLAAPLEELHDAPILYLSLEAAPAFTAEEKKKLRAFTDTGGTVLVEATCGSAAVRTWFMKLAKEVWPEWPLKPLGRDHPVFVDPNKLTARPELSSINDGVRMIVFFTGEDISCPWQTKALAAKEYLFRTGVNLFTYATDHRQLRVPLSAAQAEPRYASAVKAGGKTEIRLARLKTGGDWDVGRQYKGLDGLAALLSKQAGVTVKVEDDGLAAAALGDRDAAYLTGSKEIALDDASRQALKAYLAKGGFLWAEALAGSLDFDKSFLKLAADMGWELKPIEKSEPLMTGQFAKAVGYNVASGVRFRHALKTQRIERPWADLEGLYRDGKLVGVYCPIDVVLSSTPCEIYDCRGYQPPDAVAVGANILLFLTDRP